MTTSRKKLRIKAKSLWLIENPFALVRMNNSLKNAISLDQKATSKKLRKRFLLAGKRFLKKCWPSSIIAIMVFKKCEWNNIISTKKKIRFPLAVIRIHLKRVSKRCKNGFQWKGYLKYWHKMASTSRENQFPLARMKDLLKHKFTLVRKSFN